MLKFFFSTVTAAIVAAPLLSGCTGPKPAWAHYNECAAETSSFRAMVDCGKARRAAYCAENPRFCAQSSIGIAIVQYGDALVQQVANRELTEAQAKLKFVEFENQQQRAVMQAQATIAAGEAAAPPMPTPSPSITCTHSGNTTFCN